MEMLTQKQKFIIIIVIILVIGIVAYYYINSTQNVYETYAETENIIQTEQEDLEKVENKEENKIIVHITGAVKNNGIVEVKEKARINDVVEAAGGLTEEADLSNVNLAYMVEDGQKIYIPKKGEEEAPKTEENKEGGTDSIGEIISDTADGIVTDTQVKVFSELININKATSSELQELPGVGKTTADKIIEYRNTNGKFKTIEDLKNVSGIGDAKFELIKYLICV